MEENGKRHFWRESWYLVSPTSLHYPLHILSIYLFPSISSRFIYFFPSLSPPTTVNSHPERSLCLPFWVGWIILAYNVKCLKAHWNSIKTRRHRNGARRICIKWRRIFPQETGGISVSDFAYTSVYICVYSILPNSDLNWRK